MTPCSERSDLDHTAPEAKVVEMQESSTSSTLATLPKPALPQPQRLVETSCWITCITSRSGRLVTSFAYVGPVPRRTHVCHFVWACALTAGLVVLGGCGSESSSATGPPGARLIVIPDPTREEMFGRVSGSLGVNGQGCFTLDDRVLVVGNGWRVLPGGESIDVADVGIVEVGARATGAGGAIDGLDEVKDFSGALRLDER